MVRRFGVLGAMLVIVAGLGWAGVVNLKARRAALAATHVELLPARAADAATPDSGQPQLQGKPAPNFSLVSTDGKRVSLNDFKGRPVIINFWATWCGPCKLEMPWFEEFSTKYASQGLVVLGLDQDVGMAPPEVARAAKRIGVSYPVLMSDTDEHVSKAYGGVEYLPETFYVDRTGKITGISAGAPSKDEMQGLIETALASK